MKSKNLPKRNTRRAKPQAKPSSKSFNHTVSHPRFGQIPLLSREYTDQKGVVRLRFDYDPEYRPELPKGAVRGNISKQHFCPLCHFPKYFYEDLEKRCVQCSSVFTFTAREQKHWYEELKFYPDSQAIRCLDCRRQQRSEKALQQQLSRIKRLLKSDADNPSLLLELAECLAEYREQFAKGDVNEGVRAARRAAKLWPEAIEAVYWEARCQLAAGRGAKAEELFTRFAEGAANNKRYRSLLLAWRGPAT